MHGGVPALIEGDAMDVQRKSPQVVRGVADAGTSDAHGKEKQLEADDQFASLIKVGKPKLGSRL